MRNESKTLIEKCLESSNFREIKAYLEAVLLIEEIPQYEAPTAGMENSNAPVNLILSPVVGDFSKKIEVIKELRSQFGLTLKESKDATEDGRTFENLTAAQALPIAKKLTALGATVTRRFL